jgi:hypothetical protein
MQILVCSGETRDRVPHLHKQHPGARGLGSSRRRQSWMSSFSVGPVHVVGLFTACQQWRQSKAYNRISSYTTWYICSEVPFLLSHRSFYAGPKQALIFPGHKDPNHSSFGLCRSKVTLTLYWKSQLRKSQACIELGSWACYLACLLCTNCKAHYHSSGTCIGLSPVLLYVYLLQASVVGVLRSRQPHKSSSRCSPPAPAVVVRRCKLTWRRRERAGLVDKARAV